MTKPLYLLHMLFICQAPVAAQGSGICYSCTHTHIRTHIDQLYDNNWYVGLQAVQADAVQQSRSPPLRSIAHLRLAGKHTSAGAHQSQTSVGQRREQAALQLLLQSAPSVLQDMAAQAAEAVAVCYLAEARSGLTGAAHYSSSSYHP